VLSRFLLASSLNAVLAQRLVRKLCECKTIKTTDSAEMQKLGITNPQEIATANGCEKCGYSGYSGRKGLYELVVIDDEARSIIHTGGGENDLLKHFNGKYSSLDDQAKALVLDGETSLDEVIRVVLSK
jgi:general secretion pathway protein E